MTAASNDDPGRRPRPGRRWLAGGLLAAAAAGAVAAALLILADREPAEPPATAAGAPGAAGAPADPPAQQQARAGPADTLHSVPPAEVLTDGPSPRPLHRTSPLPPGSYIAVGDLPDVRDGIRMPDGTVLPYLNGMTWAPPVHRDPAFGPAPKVIAKVIDDGGFEWWQHADGSMTTTRYKQVTVGDHTYWDPAAEHLTPRRGSEDGVLETPPPEDGGDGDGGRR